MDICCSGRVVVLDPEESVGAEVSRGMEDAGVVGRGEVITRAGADDVEI